MGTPVYLP